MARKKAARNGNKGRRGGRVGRKSAAKPGDIEEPRVRRSKKRFFVMCHSFTTAGGTAPRGTIVVQQVGGKEEQPKYAVEHITEALSLDELKLPAAEAIEKRGGAVDIKKLELLRCVDPDGNGLVFEIDWRIQG